eukprot:gene25384-30470_t
MTSGLPVFHRMRSRTARSSRSISGTALARPPPTGTTDAPTTLS